MHYMSEAHATGKIMQSSAVTMQACSLELKYHYILFNAIKSPDFNYPSSSGITSKTQILVKLKFNFISTIKLYQIKYS